MFDELVFNPQELVADFDVLNTVVTLAGANSEEFLIANANRVALGVSQNNGGTNIAFNIRPLATPDDGWPLETTAQMSWFFRDWGSLIGRSWHASDGFGGSVFNVWEVIYIPDRGGD